jgi:hypothetical protein
MSAFSDITPPRLDLYGLKAFGNSDPHPDRGKELADNRRFGENIGAEKLELECLLMATNRHPIARN